MRRLQTLVCLTLVLIGHWAITQAATKRVAKHQASPTPAVTAAQRTAALRRVAGSFGLHTL
jgi:hypothetical protein